MNASFSKYVPVLLFPALAIIAACSDSEPAGLTSPTMITSSLITAEPLSVTPEFLPGSFCSGHPPFRVRLAVTVNGHHDLVRQLRFEFTDRFGGLAVPLVVPAAAGSSGFGSIPTSLPVPLPTPAPIPGTTPLPIPGASAFGGLGVPPGGPRTMPVHVEFGCGVPAAGTLVVTVQGTGTTLTSQVRVRVG